MNRLKKSAAFGSSLQITRSYSSANLSGPADAQIGGLIGSINTITSVTLDHSFTTGNVVCDAANGNGFSGSCGLIYGSLNSSTITPTALYEFSGATLANTGGGDGTSTDPTDPTGTIGEPLLSWFYDPSQAPMNSWDFTTVWQSNLGTNAPPSLR